MRNEVDQGRARAEQEAIETQDWLNSLNDVMQTGGPERVKRLLLQLQVHAQQAGIELPFSCKGGVCASKKSWPSNGLDKHSCRGWERSSTDMQ